MSMGGFLGTSKAFGIDFRLHSCVGAMENDNIGGKK